MVLRHKGQLSATLLTVVAVLLAAALLSALYADIELVRGDTASDTQVETSERPGVSEANGIGVAAEVALFGREPAGQQSAGREAVQVNDAPETRMNLVLKGVFVNTDPQFSGALVEADGKPAVYYQVGDELPQGAELGAVLNDHVQLRRNGMVERLSLLMAPSGEADNPGLAFDPAKITPKVMPRPRSEALQRQQVQSLRERLQQLRQRDGDVQMEDED